MKELTLLLCVCLCAAVRGSIKCSYVVHLNSCWNPTTYERDVQCFTCSLPQRSVFTSPITVFGIFLKLIPTRKPWNVQKINIFPYTDKDYRRENVCVDILSFHKSSVTKMPVIIEELFNSTVTEVRLIDTDTKVINAEFFGDNINLRTLEIAENEGLTLEGLAFANCSSLVSLHFDNNNLESLPFDAFHGMQQLVRLDLWTEGLTVLEPVWFKDLVSLKVLDLRENQLQEIPEEAFDALLELERLYLSKNKIEFITGRIFKHNVKLQTLKLSQNMIKKIQVDSFQQLSNLKWLELMGNNCTNNTFTDQNFTEIAEGLTPCYPITCIIPVIPNGFVITVEDNSTILPGDSIEELMPVKVRCNSTFLLFHDKANQTENACLASGWQDPEWPQCKRKCPYDEITGPTITADCELNGTEFSCTGQLLTGTIATIRCQLGHVKPRDVKPDLICLENGQWSHSAFQCIPVNDTASSTSTPMQIEEKCPLRDITGPSITANCASDVADFLCANGDLLPGTEAKIRCRFGYEKPKSAQKSVLTCEESGKWSHAAFKCQPICGKVARHSVPLQIGGKISNVTEVPWHVGIYKDGEQSCGGTIISERLVISAAHCFSTAIDGVHVVDYKRYQVAAGKFMRGLNATETQKTQIRSVWNVTFSMQYDGEQKWWADIVVVTIRGHFEYQLHIAPACVEFCRKEEDKYPKNGTLALVAGWGLNEEFKSSEVLQSFDIPVLDHETCEERAPVDFKEKVVDDKICAGYVDSNPDYTKVVCQGDSGGGLVIPQVKNGEKIYYLQGVVSNSQSTKNCDTSFVALFTNVQKFRNMINNAIKNTPFEENEL